MSQQEELKPAGWSVVPDLLKLLETDFPESLMFYRILELYASYKTEKAKELEVILLTPGGKVNKYGTFVLYIPEHRQNVTFYSLNPDYKEIKSLLSNSEHFDWNKKLFWGPVHDKFQPALDEIFQEKNPKKFLIDFHAEIYMLDREEAEKLSYTCPPEVYVGPLRTDQAEFIDPFWPWSGENSVEIAKFAIEKNGGLGLYLKDTDELIGWCINFLHNGPGQLFILDQHKRKGYGELLAKAITKYMAERGNDSVIYIRRDNYPSKKLFEKIGYKEICPITWSRIELLNES